MYGREDRIGSEQMKKVNKSPSQKVVQSKKYFNPYEDHSVSDYTYSRQITKASIASTAQRQEGQSIHRKKKTKPKSEKVKKPTSESHNRQKVRTLEKRKNRQELNQVVVQKKKKRVVPTYTKPEVKENRSVQGRPKLAKSKKLTKRQRLYLKRQRQIRFALRIVATMLLTIGAVFGIFFVKDQLTKTTISTQIVQTGSLDTSTTLEGVVYRSEKVVYGEDAGTAQYVIAEGEKVKKDGTVYVLADNEKITTTASQIEKVEKELYNNAKDSADTATNQDEKYNLALDVKNNFDEYYNHYFDGSTHAVYALRSKLDSNVRSRTDLYVAQQQKKDDEVAAEKLRLDQVLDKSQKGKAADVPGIVSFHMDGHEVEDALVGSNELTYEQYNKLKRSTTTTQLGQGKLEKDSPVYKLVTNNAWYIVSFVSVKEDHYVIGNSYKLYFDQLGDKAVNFTLKDKKESDGRVKLIFMSNDQMSDFLSIRGVSFSIGNKAVSGLKIPISAIVEQNLIEVPMGFVVKEDEKIGVYRKKGEVTEYINIPIQMVDNEKQVYYILQDLSDTKKLQLNDVIVKQESGETYQLTKSIVKQGVYVVNAKIASFKEIDVIDQSNEYAIVRNNNNSKLKEMDKIISNPKNVKIDQLLDDMKVQNE